MLDLLHVEGVAGDASHTVHVGIESEALKEPPTEATSPARTKAARSSNQRTAEERRVSVRAARDR